jgi:putative phosphoribosyl transferase
VRAPTISNVGGDDVDVLELNRRALRQLRTTHDLAIVPGATHLFEETGAMDQVIRLARNWLTQQLALAPRDAALV